MGKWSNDTKNRKLGEWCDKAQMTKRAQIGTNGKRNTVALIEVDKRHFIDLRKLITNTSIHLVHHAL